MIKFFTIIALIGTMFLASKLWECNRCHQQYTGDNPPPFVKCPSTNFKQNHWWIRKN